MSAVPVAITGFTWSSVLLALLNVFAGGVLVALIRSRAPVKKVAAEREANLLAERAKEMTSMRERIDALETKLAIAGEELRVVRHDLANANQSLDIFIALIEANPERAAEHARRVKEYREEGRTQIVQEKVALAALRASQIGGTQ